MKDAYYYWRKLHIELDLATHTKRFYEVEDALDNFESELQAEFGESIIDHMVRWTTKTRG